MKTLFQKLVLAVSAIVLMAVGAPSAYAQYNLTVSTLNGTTNNILASTVRNVTNTITTTRGRHVTLSATQAAVSAGATSNTLFIIDRSIDASNWELGAYTFFAAVNGTTATTTTSNIDVGAYGFLRQRVFQNTNTVPVTNVVFQYSVKTGL